MFEKAGPDKIIEEIRRRNMKLFAGGSKSIDDIKPLPNRRVLDDAIYHGERILVGDCPGADAAIQKYLAEREYCNVTVYASGKEARNNIGGWDVELVEYDPELTGYDFYRQKDIQMELDCDCAVMAWDGRSRGTRQNIIELMALGKRVDNMAWKDQSEEWYYLDGTVDELFLMDYDYYSNPPAKPVSLWLDDSRPAPEGYIRCRSVLETELYIACAEENGSEIVVIDCDHDLGIYSRLGGDGIKLLDWLAERGTLYPVALHTMNPVGRDNMQRIIDKYWK